MRSISLAMVIAAALGLSACNSSGDDEDGVGTGPVPGQPGQPGTGEPPAPEPEPEPPAAEPAVLLEEEFAAAGLPTGWRQFNGAEGAVYVQDGSLFVDGSADNFNATAVTLPAALAESGDYRIEAEFTIVRANNASRWASFVYRAAPGGNLEPYYQLAIRQDATASNGTELAMRANAAWTVTDKAAFAEAIDPGKTYKAAIVVHGGRVRQYLDGALLHDSELLASPAQGGLAIQAAGAVLRVDRIKVSEQLEALPSLGDVYEVQEPRTGAAMAPTLVEAAGSAARVGKGGAAGTVLALDAGLNLSTVSGESLGSLASYLAQSPVPAIPVLRIGDRATVDALAKLVAQNNWLDITLLSDDEALLAEARKAMPTLRAALDWRERPAGGTIAALYPLVAATNRAGAKIVLLPAEAATRDAVAYLQRMLVTVWAAGAPSAGLPQAAQLLASGVNGILAGDLAPYQAVLEKLPAQSLLRKPLVVGHRGVPSLVDENTLEGAVRAAELGADAVENDIYMTTDRHLVVMHDETVDRTTDGTGPIEGMSLEQVRALRTSQGLQVPTLDEFFTRFKGQPITHFVEIKSATPEVVDLLKEAIERHGVADQVIAISFVDAQIRRLRQLMPEVSGGYLTGLPGGTDVRRNVRAILGATQPLSTTFNPGYSTLTAAIMEAAKHRGTTFWPWTYRSEADFERFYQYGTHGLTTDYAQWGSEYPVRLTAAAAASAVGIGQAVRLAARLSLQKGGERQAEIGRLVVLESTAPHEGEGEALRFTGPGTATVLLAHRHDLSAGRHYLIYSEPVTLTVQ